MTVHNAAFVLVVPTESIVLAFADATKGSLSWPLDSVAWCFYHQFQNWCGCQGLAADHRAVAELRDELYPDALVQSRECKADDELAP